MCVSVCDCISKMYSDRESRIKCARILISMQHSIKNLIRIYIPLVTREAVRCH